MTARLAQVLQERLGSEGAAEMITWFDDHQREARQELRDLNEMNFARFDARVGERMAVLEQRFGERMAGLEQKIASVETRLLTWMIGLWVVTLSAMGVLKIVG